VLVAARVEVVVGVALDESVPEEGCPARVESSRHRDAVARGERLVEAARESLGGGVGRERAPADDGEVGQRAAQRVRELLRLARVEEDGGEFGRALRGEETDELLGVRDARLRAGLLGLEEKVSASKRRRTR